MLKDHNALVMKIGAAIEGVEADKASVAMLEVIAIGIVEASDGDQIATDHLYELMARTLDQFLAMHQSTYRKLKAQGKR